MRSGLRVFRDGRSPAFRRRRIAFVLMWLGVTAMLVWPVYPRFAKGVDPRILGLPFSFAWVIVALLVMFVSLLGLFLADLREERHQDKRG